MAWSKVTAAVIRPRWPYTATNRRSATDPCAMTTWSANVGTPTDLMSTPNWLDQNTGSDRCGQRRACPVTMLCAAISAWATAFPQCSSARNWYSYTGCGKRATSPAAKTSSVTQAVDVEHPAARVAGHAPRPGGQAGAGEPLDVAHRAERGHHQLDLQRRPVGQVRLAHPALRVTVEGGDGDVAAQVDAVRALQVGRDGADHAGPGRRTSGAGPRSATVTVRPSSRHDRGDLGAGEPGPDDQHASLAGRQPLAQPGRVLGRTQEEHAVQGGLGLVRPRAGAGSGGDEQPVERYVPAAGQADQAAVQVQAGRGTAPQPLGAQAVGRGQRRVRGRGPPGEDLFGQRRPVIGFVPLVADEGEPAGEPLPAQHLGGPQAGERGSDDDDAAVAAYVAGRGAGLCAGGPAGPP